MTRLISLAILLGLSFGVGFWVGRVTDVLPEIDKQSETIEGREKLLKNIQKRLHLSYYSELIKEPQISLETVENVESAVTEELASVSKLLPEKDKIAQALAKVLGSETPDSVKKVIKETLPAGTGSAFAIQVASLTERYAAEDLVKRLEKKGHAAKLVQAEVQGKKVYRVRIHGFKTRQEAEEYLQKQSLEGIIVAQ